MKAIGALAAAVALSGCATICGVDAKGTVAIVAAPDANAFSATAVDVVTARDAQVAARLAELEAGAWFAQRAQLRRDNPTQLDVVGWEIAPGQSIGPERVSFACGAEAIYVFASYTTPGPHRAQLPDLDGVVITLGAAGFEVTQ